MLSFWRIFASALVLGSFFLCGVEAQTCTTATVGSPYSDCYDIYTNAGLTEAQFDSYNPGINCGDLQIGQKVCISSGSLPSGPGPYPNGTCYMYTTVPNDTCGSIAVNFDITVDDIEQWNENTYKWNGCADLQVGFTLCVSTGTPPPIPIIPGLQCGPQSEGNATCPLNACCSAFGYCGLTEEFCTTTGSNPCISNCFIPTLPSCSAPASPRNIGYYEGWAPQRPCGPVSPSEVDWSGYTHAYYSFATISETFEVVLADTDIPLLQELVSLKSVYPGLQVVLSVGGWAFSESVPTETIFSLMIATTSSRNTFISSVESTLSTYDLDGLDIDFEYPAAAERNAPATDTPNLTAFFETFRAQLPSTLISIATPAGYYFLQGFEIDKIAQYVTFMNMMSYDYHGPWDTNVTDQAPVTNPQTSILDIETSAQLYVRAGIDLSNVNLGLAWYGRTYHLADASCSGYNCTMTGGGAPGPCTQASGVLDQFEVLELISAGNTPVFDDASQTYWFDDSNGDLVTFDQADTWAYKTNWAYDTCFGGTFVWAMDEIIPGTDGTGVGIGSGGSGSGSGGSGSFTVIPWNPNAYPASSAASETFVAGGSTVVLPVPSAETSITVGGAVITLGPGGTPINSLVPATVSQPNAITPTWSYLISPPAAATVTFTAPLSGVPTYSTAVPVPASGAPAVTITGSVGDPSCQTWTLESGPSIAGCLPSDVGIPGGTTPSAVPPNGWTGVWTDPIPPNPVETVTPSSSASYSYITWNPNPFPPSTAKSETFVVAGSTTSIPIPTTTTSITLAGVVITLGSGGTPVNSPIPTTVTILNSITPTWTYYISPTPDASTITFTAPLTYPPTWSTTVPIPSSSNAPPAVVTDPPGSKNPCNSDNIFSVLFGGIISGCPPSIIGIQGGVTPLAVRPPGWTGPWSNPDPLPTGDPDDEPTSSPTSSQTSTTSSSTSSSEACSPTGNIGAVYSQYILPDDAANADWEDEGTDPDYRRKRDLDVEYHEVVIESDLERRANDPRYIAVNTCGLQQSSPNFVQLTVGNYYTLSDVSAYTGVGLSGSGVSGRPSGRPTAQEHVFELGYINQFFTNGPINAASAGCDWIAANIFNYQRTTGTTLGLALVQAIDNLNNLVWVDTPMNQAKSNVVNNNANTAGNPPQKSNMDDIRNGESVGLTVLDDVIMMEYFIRSAGALGNYFAMTAPVFQATALNVQTLLSEITPPSNAIPSTTESIPMIFNAWLSSLLSSYPNGCTSRATNALSYYVATVPITLAGGYIQQSDLCTLPLYQNSPFFVPSSFNYQNLVPPYPSSSPCHAPGSQGYPGYRDPSGNHYILFDTDSEFTVMGSGSPDYYGVGTGTTMSGSHMQAEPLGGQYSSCNGVYNLLDENPSGTSSAVGVNFGCTSNTDPNEPGAEFDTMVYSISGQSLACQVLFDEDDEESVTYMFVCGVNSNDVQTCANQVAAAGPVGMQAFPISPIWYTQLPPTS